MRYQPTHAAPRDSVPFVLRGPKSLRTALAAAVAGAIGLTPAFMLTSPAQAAIAGYSISPSSIQTSEGRNLVYTVTRTGGSALLADTLYWSIGEDSDDDTVDADEDDFDEVSGVLEFPADDTTPFPNQTARITVALTDDSLFEDTESFELTISDTATIGQNSHTDSVTGGIVDNDEAPGYRLVFDDATPDESAETVLVSAELLAPSGKEVTIPISTKDGTAIEPRDYEEPDSSNDELTIPAGSTESAPVEIAIVDDETYEDKEQSFTVSGGSDPSVTGTQTGTVTIQDDDAQPELSQPMQGVKAGEPGTDDDRVEATT